MDRNRSNERFREATFHDATFTQEGNFETAQFESDARFDGSSFRDKARFDGARFAGVAYFSKPDESGAAVGASFQDVDFADAHFSTDAYFTNSTFAKQASFREATFRSVYFSPTGLVGKSSQFLGNIDLRGCTYDRIQANWRSLLQNADGSSRLHPYDRQPFVQLEAVFRRSGLDDQADDVYLERRRIEHNNLKGLAWVRDEAYKFVANFGNDLWGEIIIASVALIFGSILLSRRGAQLPADDEYATENKVSWWEAFWLSLHAFVPFGLLVKPRWKPSGLRSKLKFKYGSYVNFLRILGWILVPLAVAAMTGVLRRVAP